MLYITQDKVNKQLKQDDLAPVKYYFQVIIRPIDDIRHRFNSFYSSVRIIMQETNQEQLSQDWQNNHFYRRTSKNTSRAILPSQTGKQEIYFLMRDTDKILPGSAVPSLICSGLACSGRQDDAHNKTIKGQSFSENEDEDHPNKKFWLLRISSYTSITNNSDCHTS